MPSLIGRAAVALVAYQKATLREMSAEEYVASVERGKEAAATSYAVPEAVRTTVDVEEVKMQLGQGVEWVVFRMRRKAVEPGSSVNDPKALLYLHGGAYVRNVNGQFLLWSSRIAG